MSNLDVAIDLASIGVYVFPVNPIPNADTKKRHPYVPWRDASTVERETIKGWWRKWPAALPAIDLGKCGLCAIDGDRHGRGDGRARALEMLERASTDQSKVPMTNTPRGGVHLIFRQNGEVIGNSQSKVAPDVDTRGTGGFIFAPGAILPDGTGWIPDANRPGLADAYVDGTIPVIPEIFAAPLRKPSSQGSSGASAGANAAGKNEREHAQRELDRKAVEVAGGTEGTRNGCLNAAAYYMGTIVLSGGYPRKKSVHDSPRQPCAAACLRPKSLRRSKARALHKFGGGCRRVF